MKTLLIACYWWPFNCSGTFRWYKLSYYVEFDVLTSKNPVMTYSDGFKEESIPLPDVKAYRIGRKWPSAVWGLVVYFYVLFFRYELYIFTSPPETLLIGAWILEKIFRKKVVVDMRDKIERKLQPLKFMIPVYKFFYRQMNNVTVAWQFIDPNKYLIPHPYDPVSLHPKALKEPIYYIGRLNFASYHRLLSYGFLQDYSLKHENYATSSYPTIKKLGFKVNKKMHPEAEREPISWEEAGILMLDYIKSLK